MCQHLRLLVVTEGSRVRKLDLNALFASAHVLQLAADKLYLLTELGDLSWQANAQRWNIRNVLVKPQLRHDVEKLISQVVEATPQPNASPTIAHRVAPYYLEELDSHGLFLAASPAMMCVYKDLQMLASVDYPVLILGESGVGKELVANENTLGVASGRAGGDVSEGPHIL